MIEVRLKQRKKEKRKWQGNWIERKCDITVPKKTKTKRKNGKHFNLYWEKKMKKERKSLQKKR